MKDLPAATKSYRPLRLPLIASATSENGENSIRNVAVHIICDKATGWTIVVRIPVGTHRERNCVNAFLKIHGNLIKLTLLS
jgi:hypothetical protein